MTTILNFTNTNTLKPAQTIFITSHIKIQIYKKSTIHQNSLETSKSL